jgi:two-component system, sensor histidine kinase and response regulator
MTTAAPHPARILVVDDEPVNRELLCDTLEARGYVTEQAADGHDALERIAAAPPDVVLLDVSMPGMDGLEVCRRLKADPDRPGIPVILVTAHVDRAERLAGIAAGANDYLTKPVDLQDLVLRVGNAVALAQTHAALRRQADELRRLNAALDAQNRDMATLNRELEVFNSMVSHDLKAPVRHIAGFARLLGEHLGDRLDAESRKHLDVITASAARMKALIEDLLRFSRLGRHELRLVPVDLTGVVARSRAELAAQSPEAARVDWRQDPLPAVPGDPALLHVVFTNLLSNALKFTRGRERPVIEVSAEPDGDGAVVVAVKDNGAGFDARHGDRLFGAFQRLHADTEFEGTGMGLAIVRRVVEKHGGAVWAEGTVDRGATFFLRLPTRLQEHAGGPA